MPFRIFDRYLARQIGMATLIGVGLLSGVMVLGNVYKKLDELLGNSELPTSVVLEFVALVIPFSLIYTIPWAFLTGILLVFGRLSADNELVSLRMTGMSMPRICLPVFLLAVLLSGLCFYVNVDLAPAAFSIALWRTIRRHSSKRASYSIRCLATGSTLASVRAPS
jgi:lipopolysaccharide export LptBFGC system permease protein LptF